MDSHFLPAASIVVGLLLLILGGRLLARGATALAAIVRFSPLVLGLMVVSLGTSAPQVAVASLASYRNETELVVGAIVGGNIFSVLFILGLSALVRPMAVAARVIRLDVPVMILSSLAVLALGWKGVIGRAGGIGLLLAAAVYVVWTVYRTRRDQELVLQELTRLAPTDVVRTPGRTVLQILGILAGVGLLGLGSHWLITGVLRLAGLLTVNPLLLGLTIVAAGASLRGLIASVMATLRGDGDIAVGNVVSSCILNLLGVLGMAALLAPEGLVTLAARRFDMPVMIASAILCLPLFFRGCVISRWEGVLFVACYAAYVTYSVLRALQPATGVAYLQLILMVVLPATLILMMIGVLKTLRRQRPTRPSRHRIRGI